MHSKSLGNYISFTNNKGFFLISFQHFSSELRRWMSKTESWYHIYKNRWWDHIYTGINSRVCCTTLNPLSSLFSIWKPWLWQQCSNISSFSPSAMQEAWGDAGKKNHCTLFNYWWHSSETMSYRVKCIYTNFHESSASCWCRSRSCKYFVKLYSSASKSSSE